MFGLLCLNGQSVANSRQKCKQEDLIEFLQKAKDKNPVGRLVIILDNAKIHKSKKVRHFCARNQIYLLYLPSYSPDLNPIEYVWKDVKRSLAKFYLDPVEYLSQLGEQITTNFLSSRAPSYTKKWREEFL